VELVVYAASQNLSSCGATTMKKLGEVKMKAEEKKTRRLSVPYVLIAALLVLTSAGVLVNYLLVRSEKESAAREQLVAVRKIEMVWDRKAKMLLSEQRDKFIKEVQSDRLKEKDAFQRALTRSISKLQPKLDEETATRISANIIAECSDKNLDPVLVTALIWIESRFDPMAHSNKGAVGLMQVRYSTWKEDPALTDNGVSAKYKLYWIDLNIKCGTGILAKYYKEADQDAVRSLYRYNTGSRDLPDKVDDFEVEYVNKILITAYKISDSIRKGNNDLLINH
jgi:hypothetical protein